MLSQQLPYFILDLLQQTPAVYVRGLGRFEAIFHPAVIDVPASRIKPPYVQPQFSDGELQEDHLLSSYIHYAVGASEVEIETAIADFVTHVKSQITQNDHYVIDQFGSFSKSNTGGIRFTPDWDAFNLSFSGLETLDIRPQAEKIENTRFVPEPVVIPEPVKIQPVQIMEPVVREPEPIVEETILDTHVQEFVPVESKQYATDESTIRLWWAILGSALFLITVLCAYLAWDILSNKTRLNELAQYTPDTIATTDIQPVPPFVDTTINNDPPPLTEPDTEVQTPPVTETPVQEKPPVKKPDPVRPHNGTDCFIIVGAFQDANNIARMEEQVTAAGYVVEKITGGSLTRVAVKTSCDKSTLSQTLTEVRAKLNPEAWIY